MFVGKTFSLEALDGLTEEVGHIGRALSFHREAHHHGLAAAEHGSRFGVHRLLRQGETALADACKIEHDISDETFDCIKKHISSMKN